MRARGGGNIGNPLTLPVVTDSDFHTILLALENAGGTSYTTGKLFKFAFGENYQISDLDQGDIVNGQIIKARRNVASSVYECSVVAWCFTDQNGTVRPLIDIVNLPYSGTLHLQDTITAYSSTCTSVQDGTSGGNGCVIGLNVPATGYADIMV